jgi:hypothetical protein
MLAQLLENYFVGVSLAEASALNKAGKKEFEDDQHYCEHILRFAKCLIGRQHDQISPLLASEFADGKPLAGHEPEAMLIRAGFIGLYRNGRPWNQDSVKNLVLAGRTEDRYLIAAAWTTTNVFSRIMETNEGTQKPLNAEAVLAEVQQSVRNSYWPRAAEIEELTDNIVLCFAKSINGNLPPEDAIENINQIGGTAPQPLRSVLNAIIVGLINDDVAEAVSMADALCPNDFVLAAIASAFSATSRLRRPGLKQLLRARSIFSGTDGGNKQPDEREEHLKLVIDGIERRRQHFDNIRGWVTREDWWLYGD